MFKFPRGVTCALVPAPPPQIPVRVLLCALHAEKEFDGEMWTREGLRIKYLPQEPDLDSSLNVMENIRRGIAEQVREGWGGMEHCLVNKGAAALIASSKHWRF